MDKIVEGSVVKLTHTYNPSLKDYVGRNGVVEKVYTSYHDLAFDGENFVVKFLDGESFLIGDDYVSLVEETYENNRIY